MEALTTAAAMAIGKIALDKFIEGGARELGKTNLALLYYATDRYTEAEPLFLRVCSIFLNSLGEDHPNTQLVIDNFTFFVQQVQASGQADRLSDHPMTQAILQHSQDVL